MKKIILLFITFFVSIPLLFADTSVDIAVDKNILNTGDTFNISINISTDKESNIEITEIQGIDQFDIISQKQSSQVQIINGNTKSTQSLHIGLIGNNSGTYVLGPATIKIADEEFISNQLELIINEFTVPTLVDNTNYDLQDQDQKENADNTVTQEGNNNSEQSQNIQDKINNSSEKNNGEINKNSENTLEDIHPVKKLDINFNIFKYSGVIYFGLFILFIIIFYLFLMKILDNKKIKEINKKIQSDNILARQSEIKSIYDELLELSNKTEDFSQEDFYTELNILFRRYFLYMGIEKADKKTLSELRKEQIDNKVLDIFSMSYMYEFSTKNDTFSERKQIIMNFMIFLKK